MTREEAITQLELLLEYCESMMTSEYPVWRRDCEALRMLIAALRPISREQVGRMRGEWRSIHGLSEYYCSRCGEEFEIHAYDKEKYRFCPHCMAPMTDEAVEMAMRRWEALKDGKGD